MTTVIRSAEGKDVSSLVKLLDALFSIEVDFSPDQERQSRGLEMMLESPNAHILVAEVDDEVIGMCTVQTVISTAQGTETGWVEDVVVDERFRGHGLGTDLLEALEDWAKDRGLTRLQLLADLENEPALAFYPKRGWERTQLIAFRKLV